MVLKKFEVTILFFCLCVSDVYTQKNKKPKYEHFKDSFNHFGVSNSYVFIGGERSFIVLDLALKKKNIYTNNLGPTWLLSVKSNTTFFACNEEFNNLEYGNTVCRTYTFDPMPALSPGAIPIKEIKIKNPDVHFTTAAIEGQDNPVFIVASDSCLYESAYNSDSCYAIRSMSDSFRGIKGDFNVKYKGKINSFGFKFLKVFHKSSDELIYFLFSNHNTSKLGKMCFPYSPLINSFSKNSYEDLPLNCNFGGNMYTSAVDFVIWNEELFVAFSDGLTSILCRYSFSRLSIAYNESRKDRLSCGKIGLENSYFIKQFSDIARCYVNSLDTCRSNGEIEECAPEIFKDLCNAQLYGSVEGNITLPSHDVIYSHNNTEKGEISKLNTQPYKNHAVVYIGTDQGKIGKVLLKYKQNQLTGKPIGNFLTVQHAAPVLDIQVHGEDHRREDVYVMTKNTIVNIAEKDDCPKTGSCGTCIASKNPACGWDIEQGSCIEVSDSNSFLPSIGGECLRIDAEKIKIPETASDSSIVEVKFKFNPPVIPPENASSLQCENSSSISFRDEYFYCNISIRSTHTGNQMVVIKSGAISIASAQVPTFKCSSLQQSCDKCVENGCTWCNGQFKCMDKNSECGTTTNEADSCPNIGNDKLKLHADKEDNLVLQVSNLNLFEAAVTINDGKGKCVITDDGKKNNEAIFGVSFNHGNITCKNVMLKNGSYSVRIMYDHVNGNSTYITGTADLEVYSCNDYKSSCSLCKYKMDNYYECIPCDHKTKKCQSSLDTHSNGQTCSADIVCNDEIRIAKVNPDIGPLKGGTIVTITGQNFGYKANEISVQLSGVECTQVNITELFQKITCRSGDASTTTFRNNSVIVRVNSQMSSSDRNNVPKFEYHTDHIVHEISPKKGIKAGGRKILIKGNNIGFPSSRYTIKFCATGVTGVTGGVCVDCIFLNDIGLNKIRCAFGRTDFNQASTEQLDLKRLLITIDDNTVINSNITFSVLRNPSIAPQSTKNATVFKSGGTLISLKGESFDAVDTIRIDGVVSASPCSNIKAKEMQCKIPSFVPSDFRRRKRSTGQTVTIYFDSYGTSFIVYYADDPTINDLPTGLEFGEEDKRLLITGDRLIAGATKDDYTIKIGLDRYCTNIEITDKNITCLPPQTAPRTNLSDSDTALVIVKVGNLEKSIGQIKFIVALNILAIVVGVLAGLLVMAIVGGGLAYGRSRNKRKADQEKFALDLINLEKKISEDSREEFAEAQMTIKDIKSDLVTSRVPYLDYQSYAFHQLFPNQDMETHKLLQEPVVTDDRKKTTKEAMDMLNKLMTNKLFLKSLVKTLDNSVKKLTMQDKAHFSSLLSVALVGNMKLFYQLVICLLEETIKSASNKKQHKQLFRRFESIAQRLTVNWLQLTLYDHLQKHNGMQLFMLYKAAQTVIEKGPIDAVTNHSRNTLAEESLLKTRVEFQTMKLNIDLNGTSDVKIPVEVLDCDTVSQVKHKCCTAIYKNKPASEIPSINDLELEWHAGRGGKLVLQDIDNISDRSNGMVRLNTLKHYLVKDGSDMALMYKEVDDEPQDIYENCHHPQTSPDSVKLLMPSDSVDNSDQNRWHLSNLTDEEKSNKDHEIGEIFLNRLFQTKLILKEYIDSAFGSITDPECLSVPVRYFLCQMDKLGKEVGADSGLLQTWKSQCYATRVWASLISKPQILFDVDVPSHVEPCMDILKQVVIESFTQGAQSVTKESSSQKLLFCNDIPEYRKQVHHFFVSVEDASEGEFWSSLEQISSMQNTQLQFSKQAVLDEIYKFISKHQNEILEDFEEQNEAKDMQFGSKLEAIIEKMEGC